MGDVIHVRKQRVWLRRVCVCVVCVCARVRACALFDVCVCVCLCVCWRVAAAAGWIELIVFDIIRRERIKLHIINII